MKKIIFIMIISICWINFIYATTLCVPSQYPTIQSAIDAAQDDDIIIVSDDDYTENLTINKDITLQSESGNAGDCTINGNNTGHVIQVIGTDKTIIKGFSIINSGTSYYQYPIPYHPAFTYMDSGIKICDSDNILIQNCNFENDSYSITLLYNVTILLSGEINILENNFGSLNGYEERYIRAVNPNVLNIQSNTFDNGDNTYGDSPIRCYNGILNVKNNTFNCGSIEANSTTFASIIDNTFHLDGTIAVRLTLTDAELIGNKIFNGGLATCTHSGLSSKSGFSIAI